MKRSNLALASVILGALLIGFTGGAALGRNGGHFVLRWGTLKAINELLGGSGVSVYGDGDITCRGPRVCQNLGIVVSPSTDMDSHVVTLANLGSEAALLTASAERQVGGAGWGAVAIQVNASPAFEASYSSSYADGGAFHGLLTVSAGTTTYTIHDDELMITDTRDSTFQMVITPLDYEATGSLYRVRTETRAGGDLTVWDDNRPAKGGGGEGG